MDQDISGGYLLTSARTGEGVDQLVMALRQSIPWDEMIVTVTTSTFRRIKSFVLGLKAGRSGSSQILFRPTELREHLERTDPSLIFSDDELMASLQLLRNHGYVTLLESSTGETFVLLAPDLLINLTASFVLEARRNPKGLGALEETEVLHGAYRMPELDGLNDEEQRLLLDAAAALFLRNNLCFRETLGEQPFLIFPSLINQRVPLAAGDSMVEDVSYNAVGAIEHVYPALVVLLGYTNMFRRTHQWRTQAQYEIRSGQVCGFRQLAEREGEIELVLYYGEDTPEPARLAFRGLFEEFLSRREVSVTRYSPVTCSECGWRQERSTVVRRIREGRSFMICEECGARLKLPPADRVAPLASGVRSVVNREETRARERSAYQSALVRVKAITRD